MNSKKNNRGRKLYKYGLLGLIPIIGIVPGIILLTKGVKLRNRILSLIGIADILLAVLVVVVMAFTNIFGAVSKRREMNQAVIHHYLRLSVQGIEYYHFKKGSYPDNLSQLHSWDKSIPVHEPIYFFRRILFNYKKAGNKYILYSSGLDGIPNTKDDIYPDLRNPDILKIGLIQDTTIIKRSLGK
jgi:hypothetical protein